MFLYLGIALALQFAVWFADSLIGKRARSPPVRLPCAPEADWRLPPGPE